MKLRTVVGDQRGGRDRYRNDAYYGNDDCCKIGVGEKKKSLYKTSNFGERKDRHEKRRRIG